MKRRRRPRDTTMRRQPWVLVFRQYQRISSLSVGACGPRTGSVLLIRAVIFFPGAMVAAAGRNAGRDMGSERGRRDGDRVWGQRPGQREPAAVCHVTAGAATAAPRRGPVGALR